MKYKLIFTFLIISAAGCNSQNSTESEIVGDWLYQGDFECPDFISIKSNGYYQIENDCGANDPLNPITEKGSWQLNDKILILNQRKFVAKYSPFVKYHGKQDSLRLEIIKVTSEELLISFQKPNGEEFIEERYKKQLP